MDKKVSRKFFNDRALNWDRTARNNDPQKLRAMADRLSFPEQAWVLDVGTGTGVFLPYIKEKVNHQSHIVSMDFAFNMLEIAKAKDQGGTVEFVCAEIEALCCSKGLFDAVVCYSTFPHFHDKPRALANIHNLLKTGGWAFICHSASRETINNIHFGITDFQDHLIPERNEMENLLGKSGFSEFIISDNSDSYLAAARK